MGILSGARGTATPQTTTTPFTPFTTDHPLDPALDAPSIDDLRAALLARDVEAVHALLDPVRDALRYCELFGVAQEPDPQAALAELWARDEHDEHLGTLHGHGLIGQAWAIRGSGPGSGVSREQWQGFRAGLQRAELVLQTTTVLHPHATQAWVCRQTVARGLSLQISESTRRFQRAGGLKDAPFNARRQHLDTLLPKWQGSWPQAQEFVDAGLSQAGPGRGAWAVPLLLLIERWCVLKVGPELTAFHQSDEHRAILDTVEAAARAHGHLLTTRLRHNVLSALALLHSLAGRDREAARFFAVLPDQPTDWGWDYLADDAWSVRRTRALEAVA